jgi:hypothetical protein
MTINPYKVEANSVFKGVRVTLSHILEYFKNGVNNFLIPYSTTSKNAEGKNIIGLYIQTVDVINVSDMTPSTLVIKLNAKNDSTVFKSEENLLNIYPLGV